MSDCNVRIDHSICSRHVNKSSWIVSLRDFVHLEPAGLGLGISVLDALLDVAVKDALSLRSWVVLARDVQDLGDILSIGVLKLESLALFDRFSVAISLTVNISEGLRVQ